MGESYFWKPFAQGVATPIVLIGGTNLLLKDFKVSNPYLYWGGLAASSAVVVGILADKIKVPILNAESDNCPICKGDIYGDMSMIGEEIVPDICGDCDIYVMPQGSDFKVRCIECGYGDIYGSRTPCEECESIADKIEVVNNETFEARTHRKSYDWENRKFVKRPDGKHNPEQLRGYDHSPRGTSDSKLDWDSANMANTKIKANLQGKEDLRDSKKNAETFGKGDSANMRELRKILEEELPILVQQINKIEKQLKSLERGIPIEYPIENIRDNLDNMTEVIGRIHLQKIDYLSRYEAETFEAKVYDPMMQKKIDKNECKHRYDDGEDAWVMKYSELLGVEDGLSYVEAGVKCEICSQERIGSWGINEKEGFQITKGDEGRIPKWSIGYYGAESFEADTSKYFDETEELYGRQNDLTFSNLGTMAYNSLYMAARELGATPIEAFNLCNSKWIRHSEDYIPENMTEMFMNMLYRDKGYKHYIDGDGDYQIKDYSRNSLWNGMMISAKARIALNKQLGYDAETFNSDSHTDSFMADMPVNAVKNEHGEGWTIDSVHRRDYKETFKNWKPSKYPYEKRITQDSVNETCNSCGKENVHYQFYLPRTNSVNPKIRFIDSATYCQYDPNTCGGNICRDCADNNDSCENCGAEICSFCEEENNYEHSDLVCVDCREFNESLEDD
jgi:hypothetical protein